MNPLVARLTSKGQIVLPKPVRDQLKLGKGSCIAIYLENNQIVMKKVNPKKHPGEVGPIIPDTGRTSVFRHQAPE